MNFFDTPLFSIDITQITLRNSLVLIGTTFFLSLLVHRPLFADTNADNCHQPPLHTSCLVGAVLSLPVLQQFCCELIEGGDPQCTFLNSQYSPLPTGNDL